MLGLGLGTSLLQAMDGEQFPRNEASNNTVLWPLVCAGISLTSAKNHYGNVKRKALGILHALEKFHH